MPRRSTDAHSLAIGRLSRRAALSMVTALAAGLLAHAPAYAQDSSQLASIQAQIAGLQAQLKRLQRETSARDAELRHARDDAAQAHAEAQQAIAQARARPIYVPGPPTGQYAQAPSSGFALGTPNPNATSLQGSSPPSIATTSVDQNKPILRAGNVTVTLGGYLDTAILFRSRNLTSGTSTAFGSIPFQNTVNGHVSEFRMTAQNSRFSFLVQGQPSPYLNLSGYVEGDFDGAATSSNSVQSNSYTPRMRLAYAAADDAADGLHFLIGQNWSLATGSTIGITPRKESLPPVIDNNYIPGFVYTRQPQIRIVKDFGGKLWLAASVEAPQETYSFAGATAVTTTPNFVLPDGASVSYNNLGGSFLNSTASYSYDTAPDMVIKAALDPGFGHFEVYGLGRFFRTRTSVLAAGETHTVFGGGVGGSTVIPIIPKKLDLVGDVLAGDGIGRYGTSQLPDATFDNQGRPVPLPEIIGMAGLVGHPNKSVDVYGFVGTEQDRGSSFKAVVAGKTVGFGYGTPYASDAGCDIELASCSAQSRAVSDISVGGWWRFLHGTFGTMQAGVEYSYVKRIAFSGVGGRPTTDDNIALVSIRFLPFQ